MEFPEYVPNVVRRHISNVLEGEAPRHMDGYLDLLARAQKQMYSINEQFDSAVSDDDSYLSELRKKRREAEEHRNYLSADVECLQRLAGDVRMKEAYIMLADQQFTEEQRIGLISAAWAARIDYTKYRDRVKAAKDLKLQISNAAAALSQLLQDFSATGINGPSEFYSIADLLRATDNFDGGGRNLMMWQAMRSVVLGDRPKNMDTSQVIPSKARSVAREDLEISVRFLGPNEKSIIDPVDQARNALRYAWGVAPELSGLLDTLSVTAQSFEPNEFGMVGAAISTRQKSMKTEYVRAFATLLTDVHGLTLTVLVKDLIAKVANVVLNDGEIDVTYDDVKKALLPLAASGKLDD